MSKLRPLLCLLLVCLLFACGKDSSSAEAYEQPISEVDVAKPLKHKITDWGEFAGRFEAVERVDVRARVSGYLLEKNFRDGQYVKKGDILFTVDARSFQYEVERTNAQYTLARKTYIRAQELRKSRSISQEILDQRENEFKTSKALLDEAKLNLEFTKIKAPIDGKISDAFVDIGNLVSENVTLLTRIVTLNPIHFVFEGTQAEFLTALRLDRNGVRSSSDYAPNPIFIKLIDEEKYKHQGRMQFLDNVVDPDTGSVKARALVSNEDSIIYPGFFGRARLSMSGEYEATLLPEKAVNTDQDKKFVFVINDENQAERAYVILGPLLDNGLVVIREGLTGDEKVVVNGIHRIRFPNQVVVPLVTSLEWTELESIPNINSVPTLKEISETDVNESKKISKISNEIEN